MGVRITDKLVNELPKPSKGNRITYDDPDDGPRQDKGVSGFGIRITAAGARTFVLNYRADGRERRMRIARYGEMSVEAARKKARELRREVNDGKDPLAAKVERRQAPTVNDLCDRYITDWLPKKRPLPAADDKAMIAKIIRPRLGTQKLAGLSYGDIDQLHRNVSAATPYRANRVLSLLSKMFNLSIRWGYRTDNPTRGVQRNQEKKRKRYLTGSEMARLTQVLADHADQPTANIVRLLLLTGARRGEALAAQWSQFDLDRIEFDPTTGKERPAPLWTKPAATTKQKEDHCVPLSEHAVMLLQGIRAAAERDNDGKLVNPFVFPAPRSGKARTELKDEWRSIALAAGLYDETAPAKEGGRPVKVVNCRIHDLRHTYASLAVSAGWSLPHIGALLGHTQASTTHRYAHLMDDPLRAATNTVGALVMGKKAADVVPIREGVA